MYRDPAGQRCLIQWCSTCFEYLAKAAICSSCSQATITLDRSFESIELIKFSSVSPCLALFGTAITKRCPSPVWFKTISSLTVQCWMLHSCQSTSPRLQIKIQIRQSSMPVISSATCRKGPPGARTVSLFHCLSHWDRCPRRPVSATFKPVKSASCDDFHDMDLNQCLNQYDEYLTNICNYIYIYIFMSNFVCYNILISIHL